MQKNETVGTCVEFLIQDIDPTFFSSVKAKEISFLDKSEHRKGGLMFLMNSRSHAGKVLIEQNYLDMYSITLINKNEKPVKIIGNISVSKLRDALKTIRKGDAGNSIFRKMIYSLRSFF